MKTGCHVKGGQRRPAAHALAEQLMGRFCALPEGARIPSVRTLMLEYGVSQFVVSQALLLLREQGLLHTRVGCGGTSVTPAAANLPVLWVCGTDVFHGRVGSFWGHCFTAAETALHELNIPLEPVWLSNFRPTDSENYLRRLVLDRYRGFLFVGCCDRHPLMNYVRREGRPHVRLTYDGPEANEVTGDFDQTLSLAMNHLRGLGHCVVTVFHPDDNAETCRWPIIMSSAREHRLRVQKISFPSPLWVRQALKAGYETARRVAVAGCMGEAVLIFDEVIASGVTRAMLECCTQEALDRLDIVVHCAVQEIAAFGIPVDYVAMDTRELVALSVKVLRRQWEGTDGPDRYAVPSRLVLRTEAVRVAEEAAIDGMAAASTVDNRKG